MAEGYPIMNNNVILTYEDENPSEAAGKAVDQVRDQLEESRVDKYLESILVYQDSISVILNNGIIIRYGFNRFTGRLKGIIEVEAYI